MKNVRKQLTLFLSDQKELIEKIRLEFNPIQYGLIGAHVTLCRENEIADLNAVIKNLKSIHLQQPLKIDFNLMERFDQGKGLFIPAKQDNKAFHLLRALVLKDLPGMYKATMPHITLMHPRNSTCTTQIFNKIKNIELPKTLYFDKISLIEQVNGEKWTTIDEFSIL